MKIISKKDDFYAGINTVIKAVPQKTPMSTLDCILIDATKDNITLFATNNEIGIETIIEGEIINPGKVAINAKYLMDFIRNMDQKEIFLECDENLVTRIGYKNEKPMFKDLVGRNGSEFNIIPDIDNEPDAVISEFTLKDMIGKTLFSVSDSENNRILTGALFEFKNNKLRVITMDGHRISIRITELKEKSENKKIIIPAKALAEINKILSSSMEDMVKLYVSQKFAIFIFNNTRFYTTLMIGEFFDVDQMLSADYSTCLNINRQDFLNTVGRANLLVRETDRKPTILQITDSNIQITINTQMARFDEDIEIIKEGEDLQIGFNSKFLIEALRAIDDENIKLYFNGQISPVYIKNDEESYNYMILPINIMNEVY